MKVAIRFDGILIADVADVVPLLQALSSGILYDNVGWGDSRKFTPSESKPHLEFVEDSMLQEAPEPLVRMQESLRSAEARWLDYYRQCQEKDEEIAGLKARLEEAKNNLIAA